MTPTVLRPVSKPRKNKEKKEEREKSVERVADSLVFSFQC